MGNTANKDTFVRQWRKPTLERYKKSGGHNLPNMVGIGLTDLPKNIVGQVPPIHRTIGQSGEFCKETSGVNVFNFELNYS